ncbi:MAG: pitrilysin family protein [Bacillota bacterium]|nr:pitrilysin family protein [Bacillota bacterium]
MSELDAFAGGSEAILESTSASGTRVLCELVPGARSVAIGVWFRTGSRDDPDDRSGVSHFIEHLLFKGTTGRTARMISEEFDLMGGNLNAFTAKDHMCIYARVLDDDFERASDVLVDMVTSSRFSPDDVELERNVILDEIATYEDTPDELVFDLLEGLIWHSDRIGRPILGSEDSVSSITRDDVTAFFGEYFGASNLAIVTAGSASLDRASRCLGEPLASLGARKPAPVRGPARVGGGVDVRAKQVEQAHFCIGVVGLPAHDDRQYALLVLNSILGGGPSSRLFQKVREERGLAYSIYSFQSSYHDTGLLGVYAATSPQAASTVRQIIEEEIVRLRAQTCAADEINRAKSQMKRSLVLGLESMSSRMMRIGRSELVYGRVVGLPEVLSRLAAVRAEDVRSLACEVWAPGRVSTAAIGPDAGEIRTALGVAF